MTTQRRKKVLVFRSADVHQTNRALAHLRGQFPGAEVTLLLQREQVESFSGNPHINKFCVYDSRAAGSWKEGMLLIRKLRKARVDLVVIPCRNSREVVHLSDAIVLSLIIPAERRIILDGRLQEVGLSFSRRMRALADMLACLMVSGIATVMTCLMLSMWRRPAPGDRVSKQSGKPVRVGILIPVLPDISHTFVYREILAMIEQGADCDVIALEEGDYGVLHPEAQELLKRAIMVPRLSRTAAVLRYLFFLVRSPRRMAELIHLYRPHSHGDKLLFLRFEQFHNVFHPVQSFGLIGLLKRRGITCIHAYGSTYPATRAMVAASLLHLPFSISTFVDFEHESDFRMLYEKIEGAAFVVATTGYCASRLISMTSGAFRDRIRRIVLGIDPEYGRDRVQRVDQASPLIMAVGRLVEKKGFDYLLRSLVLLKERGLFPHCMLIGDGPERGKLQALAEEYDLWDCVTFAGALTNDKVLEYFGPEHILVAPSVYAGDGERDGIPTVLVEALICETAVVSTRISGIPELIEDQRNGLLVPARDGEAIADAIQKLLENPGLRKEYGLRGRKKVRAGFNVYKSSGQLWSLIEQRCAGSNCNTNPS
ncbi:MAG: hypothetical protein C3F12_05810 [Candidatus Methylomirabilota bacterium]|nr:glycosyltransferase [candidate division NC10 bacterium]PWB47482.1 MAG: hypothetical protein C3F12_05810 [candidate division NC10 bacterium]